MRSFGRYVGRSKSLLWSSCGLVVINLSMSFGRVAVRACSERWYLAVHRSVRPSSYSLQTSVFLQCDLMHALRPSERSAEHAELASLERLLRVPER